MCARVTNVLSTHLCVRVCFHTCTHNVWTSTKMNRNDAFVCICVRYQHDTHILYIKPKCISTQQTYLVSYIWIYVSSLFIQNKSSTANSTWGIIFESSSLKAWTSLLPRFSAKRYSSFKLWTLKQHLILSPQVALAVSRVYRESKRCICVYLCEISTRQYTYLVSYIWVDVWGGFG